MFLRLSLFVRTIKATKKVERTQAQQLHDLEVSIAEISQTVRTFMSESNLATPSRADKGRAHSSRNSPTSSIRSHNKDAATSLEHVKATQREAQQQRTDVRLRELAAEQTDQLERSFQSPSQEIFERIDADIEWEVLPHPSGQGASSLKEASTGIRVEQQQRSSQSLLSTSQRMNVTKRRSTGRARDSLDSTSVPISTLLSKRPQMRPKDADYVQEHIPTPTRGQDNDRLMFSKAEKLSSSVLDGCDVPDFTRRQIPDKNEDADLHEKLTNMWIRKKVLDEDINDAIMDGDRDNPNCQDLRDRRACLNRLMFTALHANLNGQEEQATSWVPSGNKQSSSSAKMSKEYFQDDDPPFVIYFEYKEDEMPTVVWTHMPVSMLLEAAMAMLRLRGEEVFSSQVMLWHEGQHMDPVTERLSDHNVMVEDIVVVEVSDMPHSSVTGHSSENRRQNQHHIHQRHISDIPKDSPITVRKFYAVRRGRNPGVYHSWEDCERQVSRFSGAEHKAFKTEIEAYKYLALPGKSQDETPQGDRPTHNRDPGGGFGVSKSQDKIKQSFKCPRFSGHTKDWKLWDKGFQRYLSIWDLDYVLQPDFFSGIPLPAQKLNDNKLVYFILEDATQSSPLASSYVRQAPAKNGFEAYYTLHDGFVFAGSTASTILLNDLANFRFKPDETPTELIMRLEEILQDLEMLPDDAALRFNDTQRIGYLLGALRHDPEWTTVASAITSSQVKGDMTFRQACEELRIRCESSRAYEIMDKTVKSKKKVPGLLSQIEGAESEEQLEAWTAALVSSVSKRINKDLEPIKPVVDKSSDKKKKPCLAKGCNNLSPYSLCGLHYHSIVSGKTAQLELINGYGHASYNVTTKLIEYPAKVPVDRLPSNKPKVQ